MATTADLTAPSGVDSARSVGASGAAGVVFADDARLLLGSARSVRLAADAFEADLLSIAVDWARVHPVLDETGAPVFVSEATPADEVEGVGRGCLLVDSMAAAEFGAAIGMGQSAAVRLITEASELWQRLPRLWAAVHRGEVAPWRARRVAALTGDSRIGVVAAGWVDRQVTPVAASIGMAALERMVAEAIRRFEPELDAELEEERVSRVRDPRRVDIDLDPVPGSGGSVAHLSAVLDVGDAMDVEHAVQHGAAVQKALGSQASWEVRRSVALGELARQQTSLGLYAQATGEVGLDPSDPAGLEGVRLPKARQLVLHVHLSAAATSTGTATDTATGGWGGELEFGSLVRLEHGARLLGLDVIKAWAGDNRTSVSVRPVLEVAQPLQAPGYLIPDRIRDHVIARDGTCRFPWCTRNARVCEIDHVVPYDHSRDGEPGQRGPTATWNLQALCKRHHDLKTRRLWSVRMPTPGVLIWTSPTGDRYRVDHLGTHALDPP